MTLNADERATLRRFLARAFSFAELKDIAFDLGVDFQLLSHDTASEFARELIALFERKGELRSLVTEVLRQRYDADLINCSSGSTVAERPELRGGAVPATQSKDAQRWAQKGRLLRLRPAQTVGHARIGQPVRRAPLRAASPWDRMLALLGQLLNSRSLEWLRESSRTFKAYTKRPIPERQRPSWTRTKMTAVRAPLTCAETGCILWTY